MITTALYKICAQILIRSINSASALSDKLGHSCEEGLLSGGGFTLRRNAGSCYWERRRTWERSGWTTEREREARLCCLGRHISAHHDLCFSKEMHVGYFLHFDSDKCLNFYCFRVRIKIDITRGQWWWSPNNLFHQRGGAGAQLRNASLFSNSKPCRRYQLRAGKTAAALVPKLLSWI